MPLISVSADNFTLRPRTMKRSCRSWTLKVSPTCETPPAVLMMAFAPSRWTVLPARRGAVTTSPSCRDGAIAPGVTPNRISLTPKAGSKLIAAAPDLSASGRALAASGSASAATTTSAPSALRPIPGL